MTESEAIKELQVGYLGDTENLVQAKHIAINAIQKQMKLNEMGDCYIIPKNGVFEVNGVDVNLAIQKQIPKKLINTCQYVSGCCPNCKKYISDWLEYNKFMCCPYCGQKLDWSNEE